MRCGERKWEQKRWETTGNTEVRERWEDAVAENCRAWDTHARAKGYTQRNCGKPRQEHIFLENCSPWKSHARAEEKCEKERAAKRNCYWVYVPSILSVLVRERGVWNGAEPGKRGRKAVVLTCVIFFTTTHTSYYTFILIGNKSSPSQVCFVCNSNR